MNIRTLLTLTKGEIFKFLFLNRKPKYNKKYRISICGIFKNESAFLREWIEFNHLVGVDHFYLYNNNSTDNYNEILQSYVQSGLVTLEEFPYEHAQFKAYKHFYETYRNETQWVSFLDIDEFFCPNSRLNLHEWIKPYETYPVIQIYWKMFGTSGLMEHDYNKLVIEQYHVCWKDLDHCGKCLINTDYDVTAFDSSCHHCPTITMQICGKKRKIHPINIYHRSTLGEGTYLKANESMPSIQINHYWTKAWSVYQKKRNMTDVYFLENPKKDINYFLWHENKNCSVDFSIYKFLTQLKLRISNID